MYKRILVPTDGSAVAESVIADAIAVAQACHAEILSLSVAVPEPEFQLVEGAMVVDAGRRDEQTLAHACALAEAVARRAGDAGVGARAMARLSAHPAETIVEIAGEEACDLIFMGSHGRRGLGLLLLGSVTQAVLSAATVPVMVLRPTAKDAPGVLAASERHRPAQG